MTLFPVDRTEENENIIAKLVPYAMEGQYSAGLDALDIELDEDARMNFSHETARRIQPSNSPVDNSEIAHYPVETIVVGELECSLDRIGQKILKKMLALYQDKYTIGVQEACISHPLYQEYMREELAEKRKQAFSVPLECYADTAIKNMALVPNFKVHSQQFLQGRNVKVAGISENSLLLEADTEFNLPKTTKCNFVFPPIINKKQNTNIIAYEFVDCVKKDTDLFVFRFYFSPGNAEEKMQGLQHYLEQHKHAFPLMLEQEEQRTIHCLERDLVVYNSPQIAIFSQRDSELLLPKAAIITEANQQHFPFWRKRDWFPETNRLQGLSTELLKHGHSIYVMGLANQQGRQQYVYATLRELVSTDSLNRFIIACESESLLLLQCHLRKLDKTSVQNAIDIFGPEKTAREMMQGVDSIIFCHNVTPLLGRLVSTVDPGDAKLPEKFRHRGAQAIEHFVISDGVNLRRESRFQFHDTMASVYIGRLSKVDAEVLDVSKHGLRLKFHTKRALRLRRHVRVTIKDIRLKRLKYRIVGYDPQSHELRLKVTAKDASKTALHLEKLFKENSGVYKERNVFRANKQVFDTLFNLCAQHYCLPTLTLRSGVFEHQKLSKLFCYQKPNMFLGCDIDGNSIDLSSHLATANYQSLDSPFIKSLTQLEKQYLLFLRYPDLDKTEWLDLESLGDESYCESLQAKMLTGDCQIHCLAYLPMSAERPLARMQNRNLALLSNLNREVAFLAKGSQYDVSHTVLIEDLSAIFTVCINYNILLKGFKTSSKG